MNSVCRVPPTPLPWDINSNSSGLVQWLRLRLPMQGRWVQFLVWELRSHVPFAPKSQNANNIVTKSIKILKVVHIKKKILKIILNEYILSRFSASLISSQETWKHCHPERRNCKLPASGFLALCKKKKKKKKSLYSFCPRLCWWLKAS